MKTKLAIIIFCITSVAGFSQQFSGTIIDQATGRVQFISGETEKPYQPYQPIIDFYTKSAADTQARIDQMSVESELAEQSHQLRMQTILLRQLVNE